MKINSIVSKRKKKKLRCFVASVYKYFPQMILELLGHLKCLWVQNNSKMATGGPSTGEQSHV